MDKKIKLIVYGLVFLFVGSCNKAQKIELPRIYFDGHPKKCEACEEIY